MTADPVPEAPGDWPAIRAWRRAQRAALLARREACTVAERAAIGARVLDLVGHYRARLCGTTVGLYWPFKGEIDLRALATGPATHALRCALPVVVAAGAPLEFRAWRPGDALTRGVWDIPIPVAGAVRVAPRVLLVPLLGYDDAGYRLGYGGGYYDRTLAAMQPRPLTIAVGHAAARLASIHPQAHDVPMDVIVTEQRVVLHRVRGRALARGPLELWSSAQGWQRARVAT